MAEHTAPFQLVENAPMEAQVEEMEDGTFAIGDPVLDEVENTESDDFYENLADELDEPYLKWLGQEVTRGVDDDEASRTEWKSAYVKGLQTVAPEEAGDSQGDRRSSSTLAKVQHPVILEAAVAFAAKAMPELFPSGGPVGSRILGTLDDAKEGQATRVRNHMNYQLTEEMEEYEEDLDRLLMHLPLTGMAFKKCWYDSTLGRNMSRFVEAEDFVTSAYTIDLASSPRYTHIMPVDQDSFLRSTVTGYYSDIDIEAVSNEEEDNSTVERIQGITKSSNPDDFQYVLFEQHINLDLPGFEQEDGIAMPYIVTVDSETSKVVRICRNWKADDVYQTKRVWFVPYRFLPGLGFYGFGLYHAIGGLGAAATGSLRALLDSAAYATMQGGFKLKGRTPAGQIEIDPGEFVDIDSPVDDVSKAIMPLPFKEPSATLFQLLGFVVDAAQRFANTTEMTIADANANTPVGTTIALLEEGSRVFTSIHKRLHRAQRKEFKLLAELNFENMPDQYPFEVEGANQFVLKADYDGRVDVIPISNPNAFSSTQRISQAQAILALANQAPELHDRREAFKRMHEALQTPDLDKVMPDPVKAVRLDAVAENAALLRGHPITPFDDQDHMAHMSVLDSWYQGLPEQGQAMLQQQYMDHRAQHMALFYTVMVGTAIGQPIQNKEFKEVQPQQDMLVTQQAAAMLQQTPPLPSGPPLPGQEQQDGPGNDLQAIAQAEIAKAQAQAQATQIKTQADVQGKQQKAQVDAQLRMAEGTQKLEIKQAEAAVDSQLAVQKMMADLEEMKLRMMADIALAQQKSESDIEAKMIEIMAKAEMQQTKADADAVTQIAEAAATVDMGTTDG